MDNNMPTSTLVCISPIYIETNVSTETPMVFRIHEFEFYSSLEYSQKHGRVSSYVVIITIVLSSTLAITCPCVRLYSIVNFHLEANTSPNKPM